MKNLIIIGLVLFVLYLFYKKRQNATATTPLPGQIPDAILDNKTNTDLIVQASPRNWSDMLGDGGIQSNSPRPLI